MKFKIDENLPVEFADLLAVSGHETLVLSEQNLQGKADQVVIDVCRREGYILVTLDLDFANILAYPPDQYAGVMVLRPSRQDKAHIIEMLRRAIPLLGQESIERHLWIVEESRVRIRGGGD